MNTVVMRVTARAIVGGRRGLWLMIMPAVTLGVAGIARALNHASPQASSSLLDGLILGIIVPITCLLISAGAIGSEIEDGSIVYVLSKPISRASIATSKLLVAFAAAILLAMVPTSLAAIIAGDDSGILATSFGVAAAVASLAYIALFFWLSTVSRNAIVIGLGYALAWEGLLGGFVTGVRNLSVHQWALAWGKEAAGGAALRLGIEADVATTTATVLIVVVVAAGLALSARALRRLQPRPTD
jgi:ABC-2 type transport system permease protein